MAPEIHLLRSGHIRVQDAFQILGGQATLRSGLGRDAIPRNVQLEIPYVSIVRRKQYTLMSGDSGQYQPLDTQVFEQRGESSGEKAGVLGLRTQ